MKENNSRENVMATENVENMLSKGKVPMVREE